MVKNYPTGKKDLDEYLQKNKDTLINRKIKSFDETNWFEWGAPRNVKLIEENWGKECIYISNLTRQEEVAFVDKV